MLEPLWTDHKPIARLPVLPGVQEVEKSQMKSEIEPVKKKGGDAALLLSFCFTIHLYLTINSSNFPSLKSILPVLVIGE